MGKAKADWKKIRNQYEDPPPGKRYSLAQLARDHGLSYHWVLQVKNAERWKSPKDREKVAKELAQERCEAKNASREEELAKFYEEAMDKVREDMMEMSKKAIKDMRSRMEDEDYQLKDMYEAKVAYELAERAAGQDKDDGPKLGLGILIAHTSRIEDAIDV
jgi:flagellar biosynthesis/type III secretory pathway protein FliH